MPIVKRTCCVKGCLPKKGEYLSHFQFPNKDHRPIIFNQWIKALKNRMYTEDEKFITEKATVCSRHFLPSEMFQDFNSRRRSLDSKAVPSIFMEDSLPPPPPLACLSDNGKSPDSEAEDPLILTEDSLPPPPPLVSLSDNRMMIEKGHWVKISKENLISAISRQPGIWDNSNERYHKLNIELRENYMWECVAKDLKLEANDKIIKSLKEKWRCLETRFRSILRECTQSESDSARDKKVAWKYFDKMSFLNETMGPNKNTSSSLNTTNEVNESEESEVETAIIGEENNTSEEIPQDEVACTSSYQTHCNLKRKSFFSKPRTIKRFRNLDEEVLEKQLELLTKKLENDRIKSDLLKQEIEHLKMNQERDEDKEMLMNTLNLCLPLVKRMDYVTKFNYWQHIMKATNDYYREHCLEETTMEYEID